MNVVYQNSWFSVCDRDGYFTIEYPAHNVIILPVVEGQGIVFVKVIRPVINDCTYELPAGGGMEGESTVQTAARELMEETGIVIDDLGRFERLIPLSHSPNRNPEPIEIFKIQLSPMEYDLRGEHDDEVTEVRLLSLEETKAMIVNGEIYVAGIVAVIGRYLLEL